ncbi:hypothetical protein SAMN05192564_10870 [Paraburkholderia sartisoli]|uniref:Uncharacterized protein n=1 Tax=Paraburkholderia sartisoli TaxID=83784 RepID=A0A1H4HC80_9BURK|nr:hypothetical protein SAMN05192564_10870 [Paraburkholderia sartisoli]
MWARVNGRTECSDCRSKLKHETKGRRGKPDEHPGLLRTVKVHVGRPLKHPSGVEPEGSRPMWPGASPGHIALQRQPYALTEASAAFSVLLGRMTASSFLASGR